jgi:hypothetical protein
MNWEILAAIGQLAAVLVGIPSLIYLGVQIREQTKERPQSAVNALIVHWGDLTKSLHNNAEFGAIYLRGLQRSETSDRDSLRNDNATRCNTKVFPRSGYLF